MKHTIKLAMIAAVLILNGFTTQAQNQLYPARTLVMFNQTNEEMSYCYAYFDMRTQIWTSVGWGRIMANSSASIQIGSATTPNFFVHTQDVRGHIWGGDNYFCANQGEFRIPNADKDYCGSKMRFRPVVLNDAGETDMYFTRQ